VPRSSQTAHLALEAPFFDHQVRSWLRPTLPLWSSIHPGSNEAEPESFEARFGWSVTRFEWSAAQFVWTKVDPVAWSPKARSMRTM